ncbi:MAG: biopolymer transporter ExbD [Betaproteobacteria bacterium]
MALFLRNGGTQDEVIMDINTTPLIDVMLVLLVMLIITIPIQLHAVNMDLPVAGSPPLNQPKPEKIQIDVTVQGQVRVQGVEVDLAELEQSLQPLAGATTQSEIHIRPHKAAPYALFTKVLATTKRLGLVKVAIVGSEQFL